MKKIRTNGITYLENLDTSSEWYLGTDYACGDLYEAEEVFWEIRGRWKKRNVLKECLSILPGVL